MTWRPGDPEAWKHLAIPHQYIAGDVIYGGGRIMDVDPEYVPDLTNPMHAMAWFDDCFSVRVAKIRPDWFAKRARWVADR